jgi:hypothetical protein
LGYDKHTRLTPLTTDFHEFVAQVGEENRTIIDYGPFFKWDEKVRKDHPLPMGPGNPQALNRYSYVVNNPLRYTDPSGHCFIFCLITGVIGAIAGAIGSVVTQVTTTGHVDGGDVLIAAGVGFGTGFVAPISFPAYVVASAVGGGTQYALTELNHGRTPSAEAALISAGASATVSFFVGPIPQPSKPLLAEGIVMGARGIRLPTISEAIRTAIYNLSDRTAAVLTVSNLTKSVIASGLSNLPWQDILKNHPD